MLNTSAACVILFVVHHIFRLNYRLFPHKSHMPEIHGIFKSTRDFRDVCFLIFVLFFVPQSKENLIFKMTLKISIIQALYIDQL